MFMKAQPQYFINISPDEQTNKCKGANFICHRGKIFCTQSYETHLDQKILRQKVSYFHICFILILIRIITIIKVVTAGEGVEDAEEGGGSVAQVWRPRYHCCSSTSYDYHHPSPPRHPHHKSSSLSHDDQAVLSLAVTEEHIAGLFKCEAKHAATSKSLFNVTKIDVQCNHFHHSGECDSVVTMIILMMIILIIIWQSMQTWYWWWWLF